MYNRNVEFCMIGRGRQNQIIHVENYNEFGGIL